MVSETMRSTHPTGHPVTREIASSACKSVGEIMRARFGDLRKVSPHFQKLSPVCIRTQRHKGLHKNGKLTWR